MAIMRDIVNGAYKRLGLIQLAETPTSEEAAEGLLALNDMMHGWKSFGVDIEHTTKTLDETFPLGAEFDGGVKAMLAIRLAEENGLPVTPQLAASASSCWKSLQADYIVAPEHTVADSALEATPSQRRWYYDLITSSTP